MKNKPFYYFWDSIHWSRQISGFGTILSTSNLHTSVCTYNYLILNWQTYTYLWYLRNYLVHGYDGNSAQYGKIWTSNQIKADYENKSIYLSNFIFWVSLVATSLKPVPKKCEQNWTYEDYNQKMLTAAWSVSCFPPYHTFPSHSS